MPTPSIPTCSPPWSSSACSAPPAPTRGHLQRPSDGAEPKKIAWLQCVGSRDINHCDNGYCSAVCCMYAIKEAVIAKEHSHDPWTPPSSTWTCAPTARTSRSTTTAPARSTACASSAAGCTPWQPTQGDSVKIEYATEDGEAREETFDMVVLAIGLQTGPEAIETASRLGVDLDQVRLHRDQLLPARGHQPAGHLCLRQLPGPKDIPQSVMEASARGLRQLHRPGRRAGARSPEVVYPLEKDISGQSPRVGVFVCHCGINIGGVVDVPAVVRIRRTCPTWSWPRRTSSPAPRTPRKK